ncbi:unnamed protein product [Blumeria hordei]|uniref:SUN domain-containing protein n=1 Tax=Blumeria hordei TaxID=2867405 RepID=A0A383V1J4_BLUHO|nr:unnamed protein product [Blumeria hordei]
MQFSACSQLLAALLLFHPSIDTTAKAFVPTSTSNHPKTSNSLQNKDINGTCKFRTINYITDSLPQQCFKNTWSAAKAADPNLLDSGGRDSTGNITATLLNITSNIIGIDIDKQELSVVNTKEVVTTEDAALDLSDNQSAFLSFEEWKKLTLEKAGQKDVNISPKKPNYSKTREFESYSNNLESLGDEGNMDLKFSFRPGGEEFNTAESHETNKDESMVPRGQKQESYRSKDAGKTCKERFSYSSFDAGATILKTHPGAKNAKNILIENKDSYMLSECSLENKFIIIELSQEDIWIDTVVLANYEFFSSMIRTFRVSVSDRYPVKLEKWKDIGTYEARNSRELQAFLIENPQIWARYIRIEFLDHYGNEYYCPLSLVRVHGTRMLESWKETESADEDADEAEDIPEMIDQIHDASASNVDSNDQVEQVEHVYIDQTPPPSQTTLGRSTWRDPGLYIFNNRNFAEDVCPSRGLVSRNIAPEMNNTKSHSEDASPLIDVPQGSTNSTILVPSTTFSTVTQSVLEAISSLPIILSSSPTDTSVLSSETAQTLNAQNSPVAVPTDSGYNNTSSTPVSLKNKVTQTTTSPSALPTIQESFFKAVSRRLTLLESNSTLSLTYISEATSHLHQAFTTLSRSLTRTQLNKTTAFLDSLNSTVLSELRGFRQQYDEIWQSTVISLESQRDESRQEILAVSERLNILAQEVVWQRRMGIIQSILLLLCLGFVIFSRVSTPTEPFFIRPRSRAYMYNRADPRYFNGDSLSEPESPNQWYENRNSINQTPNCAQAGSRHYISHRTYENQRGSGHVSISEPSTRRPARSPLMGFFSRSAQSPLNFDDNEQLTPTELVPDSQSNGYFNVPGSPSFFQRFRRARPSLQARSSGISASAHSSIRGNESTQVSGRANEIPSSSDSPQDGYCTPPQRNPETTPGTKSYRTPDSHPSRSCEKETSASELMSTWSLENSPEPSIANRPVFSNRHIWTESRAVSLQRRATDASATSSVMSEGRNGRNCSSISIATKPLPALPDQA